VHFSTRKQANPTRKWLFLGLFTAFILITNLSLGSLSIPILDILKVSVGLEIQNKVWTDIIIDFRLTKALTCILAGSALSLGGLQMQTLFRNALAGPDILGLSSGASLAVSLVFMAGAAGVPFFSSSMSVAFAAFVGSAAMLLLVLAVAARIGDNVSLLLVGLMIGAATASFVSILQYLSRAEDQQYYLIWTFGSLGSLNWEEIVILSIALLFGSALALINLKSLNAWLLGERYAKSLGINLKQSKLLAILSTSILTGTVTAFCGPIAFVGLAVPHLVRLLLPTSDHKTLLPAVALGGASLLLLCDCLAQLPGSMFVLPINVITTLVGAPVVIWIIIRGKKVHV
jgi:iron complex transport system permease protein